MCVILTVEMRLIIVYL